MSDKNYKSIGETLELIKEEFPEVTISKIRFLETQGLIAPERTTNGYRMFYDHDIQRLAFVLRQQREQFLPLKVIKDRITEKEPGVFVLDPTKGRFAKNDKKRSKFESDIFGEPLDDHDNTPRTRNSNAKAETRRRQTTPETPNRPAAKNSKGKLVADGREVRRPSAPNTSSYDSEPISANEREHGGMTQGYQAYGGHSQSLNGKQGAVKRPRLFALPSTSSLAENLDDTHGVGEALEDRYDSSDLDFESGETPFPKNSFTARDIAECADMTLVQVADLTTYGLLNPTSVRGQQIYSAADLELATLAKGFNKFGLEARHLRMYKVSAEREASFLEQVILPILANKSQKSRNKAEAALTQLGEIGAQFRTLLLERAIEKILKS